MGACRKNTLGEGGGAERDTERELSLRLYRLDTFLNGYGHRKSFQNVRPSSYHVGG